MVSVLVALFDLKSILSVYKAFYFIRYK